MTNVIREEIESIFVKLKENESNNIDIVEYDLHLRNGEKYITKESIGDSKAGDKVDLLLYDNPFSAKEKECIILNNRNAQNILKEDRKTDFLISLNIITSLVGVFIILGAMLVKGLNMDLSGAMIMCSGIFLLSIESWKIGSFKIGKEDRKYIEKKYNQINNESLKIKRKEKMTTK